MQKREAGGSQTRPYKRNDLVYNRGAGVSPAKLFLFKIKQL